MAKLPDRVRAGLLDWEVQIGGEEEYLEVARRLDVLIEILQRLMEQYPNDERTLMPRGLRLPGLG